MEAILIYGVPRALNTIRVTTSKLKTRGGDAFQELSVKDRNTDEESVSKGGLIPHKYPMCFIEGPFMLTGLRRTRRYLGAKELGQAYDQPEQVLSLIRNDATRPIALPFLTHIAAKIP